MGDTANQQPFMILGHGAEDIGTTFEERRLLPDGYTLVTLSECGVVTFIETVSRFLAAFGDNTQPTQKMLSDPTHPANRRAIEELLGQKIHIYRSGTKYPSLTIRALVDWKLEDEGGLSLMKSGLYSYPLDKDLFTEPYAHPHIMPTKSEQAAFGMRSLVPERFSEPIKQLYTGAIFPTSQMVKDAWVEAKLDYANFGEAMMFPLEAMFEAGGPGVYYYIICRSPKKDYIKEFVEGEVTNKNLIKRYQAEKNTIKLIPNILPLAERLSKEEIERLAKGGKKVWRTENTLAMPARLQKLYEDVMLTRRKSIGQQEAGERRRRRRQTKKPRKTRKSNKKL